MRIQAHLYDGYWEDVGTIGSYFDAQLALTEARPPFSFYDPRQPIYTDPRFLPATKIVSCDIVASLISEGCWIDRSRIERSVIGIRGRIASGARLRRCLMLGADYYESVEEMEEARREGLPPIGVGEETVVENAIIDKNARVGRGVRILNEAHERERDAANYSIRDGIVVVPKGAVVPDGTVI